MTRVTALEPSGNLYGSEYCLLDIIEGTRQRFDWDVILPGGGGFDTLLGSKGIRVARLLVRDSHTMPLSKKISGYLKVRRHISKTRPDVVYVNQAGLLRAANVMTRGTGASIVCQIQTLEDAKFIASMQKEQARVRTFICNSEFIARASRVPPEKLAILYQPMMPGNRPQVRDRISDGPPWRVAILGRISETKGHYVLVEAAKILASRGRSDICIVVIGTGLTPEDTQRFENSIANAGLQSTFEMRGYRSAAHDELSECHLAVIPSIAEPYGRVLLDAAATQTPAIVSDGGGLGELAAHFGIGRRFHSGDAGSLANAIADALADYSAERKAFESAATRMLERLDPGKYIDAAATIIANAADGKSTALEWLGES